MGGWSKRSETGKDIGRDVDEAYRSRLRWHSNGTWRFGTASTLLENMLETWQKEVEQEGTDLDWKTSVPHERFESQNLDHSQDSQEHYAAYRSQQSQIIL